MDWIQFFKNSLPDQALVLERLPSEEPVLYQLKASNIPVKDKVEFAQTADDFTNAATSTLLNVLADPSINNVRIIFRAVVSLGILFSLRLRNKIFCTKYAF